ncbi:heme o synthase [Oricola cellulosilytica]|uniref:Protoheme IX farnesyltransferase n=1 Tax=Oricola cellulosilytica TaxID=1429082 RepID=A0A4R0P9E2_9HYPH|nr:heme o synthase [Oricola cellulosilytica]TCD13468.1 protoheme IX farnesyltransferase [Oricola cellulosilytica]
MALVHNIENGEARISEAMPGDYFALLKPRVMSLVVFTAFVGMILAPGGINPLIAAIAILAIAVGAGASGALNMWYDADIDAVMTRTAKRPIPSGRVTRGEALAFGLTLSVLSVLTLGTLTNWIAGGLLAFTIFFYAVIYTMWLKRSTPQNIVIGGAAGAFPPMIGWAAASGTISLESVVLFLIIFLWTPPHFWALALFKLRDYDMANVPMLPNVAGERHTKLQILAYSLVLAVVAAAPWPMGLAGPVYGLIAIGLGANFVRHAISVWRMEDGDATMVPAKKLFRFSLYYLATLFAVLLGERLFEIAHSAQVA